MVYASSILFFLQKEEGVIGLHDRGMSDKQQLVAGLGGLS